ncbi:hypothetical protein DMP51_07895 [Klebsiella pneumoniae]|nr:hypothetical protein DMP51_07895 [Klebsiella pneumoniae]
MRGPTRLLGPQSHPACRPDQAQSPPGTKTSLYSLPLPGGADACAGLRDCRARRPIPHVGRVRHSRHPAQKRRPTRSHCPAALALARAYEIAGPAVPSRM